MDFEYEKFVQSMNRPRVVIDNENRENSTVVKVDSGSKHGTHLEIVQILSDLNLDINKAYISFDGGWSMDVFYVTDQYGNKVIDETDLDYIRKSLTALEFSSPSSTRSIGVNQSTYNTVIELSGSNRLGLLHELSSVLSHFRCNVVNAEMWTKTTRVAAVIEITDGETGLPITEQGRKLNIINLLRNVLEAGDNAQHKAKVTVSHQVTCMDRRLHQIMCADRDYEDDVLDNDPRHFPRVNVANLLDKDYSVVNIRSQNRPKLLFDTLCALTDMQYMVFHASIFAESEEACQEYFIRHVDGWLLQSEAERQRVTKCLEAAILRRVSKGVKLEVHTTSRVGLLSDIVLIFRENDLQVTRAEVKTKEGKALGMFYVCDAKGDSMDAKTLNSVRQSIGIAIHSVKESPAVPKSKVSERN